MYLQLQLQGHLNKNSTLMNKLTLRPRRGQLQYLRSLSGIDFVQINYGRYEVPPQTTGTRNT